jgi:hypothetical protein
MAYSTPDQFLLYYDVRRVSQLLSDSGTPVGLVDVPTNAVLLELLSAASEMVAAAALVGKRYTTANLETLADSASAGFLLRKLVIDIAFALLVIRRGQGAADVDRLCPAYSEAQRLLEQLRLGYTLFPGLDDPHAEAGLPAVANLQGSTQTNRITKLTAKAHRIFPFHCDRIVRDTDCCN